MATILITCAGSGVGQSVLDSLNLRGSDVLIGCDLNEHVFAYNYCHRFFIPPGIYDPGYSDFILKKSIQEDVDLIILGHDHELLLFSKNIDRFRDNNIEVIVSAPDVIEISRDKLSWYKYFNKYGCSIVLTLSVKEFKNNPDDSIFPAIVKPVGGSASQGIHIINDCNQLREVDDQDIIQPYLFPVKKDPNYDSISNAIKTGKFVQRSEISIQIVFSKQSEMAGLFISKNILKDGVPIFVDPIHPDNFDYIDEINKFIEILKRKKVKGPVNLQGRITEKGFFFFEMNMRFTGITGTRAKLGFNEVEYLVDNFLDKPAALNGYAINKVGVRQIACLTKPRTRFIEPANMVYTILGASGYIGSFFVHELIKKNEYKEMYLVCRKKSYKNYLSIYPDYSRIHVVVDTDPELESKYAMSDVLVNFAGSRANENDTNLFNSIIFQYKQVQKISLANIPLIINISSQSLYNQQLDTIKNEDTNLSINNLYALQKYLGEKFFNSINKNCPLSKVISLRFTRVIGVPYDGGKPNGFFAKIIESLINDQYIDIPYPNNKINLIDIRDAVGSIFHLIKINDRNRLPSIMNIGGRNMSIKEYCKVVIKTLQLQSKKNLVRFSDSSEIKISSMVDSNLAKIHNWSPRYTIEETIKYIYNQLNYK